MEENTYIVTCMYVNICILKCTCDEEGLGLKVRHDTFFQNITSGNLEEEDGHIWRFRI
jgi:hypothetical protein